VQNAETPNWADLKELYLRKTIINIPNQTIIQSGLAVYTTQSLPDTTPQEWNASLHFSNPYRPLENSIIVF